MARKYDCGWWGGFSLALPQHPAMEISRKGALGIALIIISIFAAAGLIRASDQTELYWVATKRISLGDRITSEDVALARLYLPGRERTYLHSREEIYGLIATGSLFAGEAIARSDLTDRSDNILWRLVSLDIARADIPVSVGQGSIVDLYRLADSTRTALNGTFNGASDDFTQLVLTSLVVDEVISGGSLSERTQVILRVRLPEVRALLDAYSKGPLLVVDHVI